jgi:tetratricopeptide (TPR) repeat protein
MNERALARARASGSPGAESGILSTLGQIALSRGRCDEAVRLFGEGAAIVDRRASAIPAYERAAFLVSHGQVKDACEGDVDGLLARTTQAVELARTIPDGSIASGMPDTVFRALVFNGHAYALTRKRQFGPAREAVREGLAFAAAHPDGRSARIALLRSLAAVESGEENVRGAAQALEEATALAKGHSGPFEAIRLQVMAARRWAEAGDHPRAIDLADRALADAEAAAADVRDTRWMILTDAALAYMNANQCARALAVAREAEAASPATIPPQWLGNRLSVEALCLADAGRADAARSKAAEALKLLAPYLSPTSPLKKRLETVSSPKF